MFKIDSAPEFTHTVSVMTPIDGGHREDKFKARFKVVEDEADQTEPTSFGVDAIKDHLRKIVVGMDDLADATGTAIPYSDEVREQMLSLPHVRLALLRTYRNAFAKERAGN